MYRLLINVFHDTYLTLSGNFIMLQRLLINESCSLDCDSGERNRYTAIRFRYFIDVSTIVSQLFFRYGLVLLLMLSKEY